MQLTRPIVVLTCLAAAGCATTDDLESLKASVDASLKANRSAIEMRMRPLEELKRQWQEQQASLTRLNKNHEDLMTRLGDLDRQYQTWMTQHSQSLASHRQEMDHLGREFRHASEDVAALRSLLEETEQAVDKVLDMEEAFYRDAQRSIQGIRKDMSSRRPRTSRLTSDTLP